MLCAFCAPPPLRGTALLRLLRLERFPSLLPHSDPTSYTSANTPTAHTRVDANTRVAASTCTHRTSAAHALVSEAEADHEADREPPRYLLQDAAIGSALYPHWAPRDVGPSDTGTEYRCSTVTYAHFCEQGLHHHHHVALALLGHGGTRLTPPPREVRLNPFARPGDSYLHMPFEQIAGFLTQLHP